MKTYLNDIMTHYFDVQDLNADKWELDANKWAEGENGFYTTNQEEIEWFTRLNEAYDNLTPKELRDGDFNDYDDLIAFYEGRQSDDVE